MKQSANTKPSWLHLILAAEFDRASALFCMQWAIEDEDFDMAMYHQLDYLLHTDNFLELHDKLTPAQSAAYWEFKARARGMGWGTMNTYNLSSTSAPRT